MVDESIRIVCSPRQEDPEKAESEVQTLIVALSAQTSCEVQDTPETPD